MPSLKSREGGDAVSLPPVLYHTVLVTCVNYMERLDSRRLREERYVGGYRKAIIGAGKDFLL